MIMELVVMIVFAVVLILLIGYFYLKDKSQSEKLIAYEKAIDDLNSRLHDVEEQDSSGVVIADDSSIKKECEEVEKRVTEQINELGDHVLNTIRSLKDIEMKIQDLDQRSSQEIKQLQQSIKQFTLISPTNSTANEDIVLDLYKKGYSAEEIAKNERIPIGEVELILKIANLR